MKQPREFPKVRSKMQIEADPRVDELWSEDDGWNDNGRPAWWCALKLGYSWCPETHVIHEGTIREVAAVLNNDVDRCDAACPCRHESA